MDSIENSIYKTNILYKGSHKIFQMYYGMGKEYLKHFLTHLYCTKHDGIYMSHSYLQNVFPIRKGYKKYKYFVYRLT